MRKVLVLTTLLVSLAGTNEIHAQSWLRGLGRAAENAGMKTVSENTGISVTGRETVTVSGSQIDCYIIESTVATSALGFKSSMTQKVWYGRGVGQVRSESYNKNGKLMSLSELVEIVGY